MYAFNSLGTSCVDENGPGMYLGLGGRQVEKPSVADTVVANAPSLSLLPRDTAYPKTEPVL